MSKPFLSVVIPAFNEQERIGRTLESIVSFLNLQEYTWEIVVVDDGSRDDTLSRVVEAASSGEPIIAEAIDHAGKGWAVRHGMLAARGEYRFMCDADLATPVEELPRFLEAIAKGYDIIIGSRQIQGARRYGEPALRHALGRVFNWTVKLLAVRGFQDTQCGFKLFSAEAADGTFSRQRTRGWGFDVEILFLAGRLGLRVLEMPVSWSHQPASKVRPGVDAFNMLRETLLVRWRSATGQYGSNGGIQRPDQG